MKGPRVPVRMAVCGVALLGLALGSACTPKAGAEPAPPGDKKEPGVDVDLTEAALAAGGIKSAVPRRGPRRTSVVASGTIDFEPGHVARVGPLVDGRVAAVKVKPGAEVTAGAVLATLTSLSTGKARADHQAARLRLARAEVELARQESLFKDGATTAYAVTEARTEVALAKVTLAAASEQLGALGADGSAELPLKAPIGGRVLTVGARIGQVVSASETLFVVGTIDEVWLSIDVYERDFSKVHLADEARVTALAWPDRTFVGHVDHIDTVVDPVRRAFGVRVVLPNKDGALRPGMTASTRLLGASTDGTALFVPKAAIQGIDGLPIVFVQKGGPGKFALRPIERGAEVEGDVEVLSGLDDKESIAVAGTFILKSEYLREQMGKND